MVEGTLRLAQTIRSQIGTCIPGCRFEFPRAPTIRISSMNGTAMLAWFDVTHNGKIVAADGPSYCCSFPEAQSNVKRIHKLIDGMVSAGIPATRIFLSGFSQGGTVAMLSAMQYPQRLGGCIVFSAILLGIDKLKELIHQENSALPMLWVHGSL